MNDWRYPNVAVPTRDVAAPGTDTASPETPSVNSSRPLKSSLREGFYFHVGLFLIVSWNLVAINAARTPDYWWAWMPVAAWAVVLAIHGMRNAGRGGIYRRGKSGR